jgi:hypothetical protein
LPAHHLFEWPGEIMNGQKKKTNWFLHVLHFHCWNSNWPALAKTFWLVIIFRYNSRFGSYASWVDRYQDYKVGKLSGKLDGKLY